MTTTSYWLAQALPKVPTGSGAGPVDVVVVGGGVTGCSCALTLARGGRRVRLLEAGEIAGGASGRNGGFALRGLAADYAEARARLGREAAAGLWGLTEHALDRMAELAGDALRRVGSLRLAADEAERDALRSEYEALCEDGFESDWLDPLPDPLPRLFAGGFLHPRDGTLSPALWVRRLAAHAAEAGAELVEHHPVDREAVEALAADAVVIAVDGLTDALLPELSARSCTPCGGRCSRRSRCRSSSTGGPTTPATATTTGSSCPTGGWCSAAGATWAARPSSPRRTRRRPRSRASSTRSPPSSSASRRGSPTAGPASGVRPPICCRSPGRVPGTDRLWVAGGYSGHGNVLGFACGDLVAQALLGA